MLSNSEKLQAEIEGHFKYLFLRKLASYSGCKLSDIATDITQNSMVMPIQLFLARKLENFSHK